VTDEGRRKRIQDALREWQGRAEPKENLPLTWRGQQRLLPVVDLDLDVPLLNTTSHRLRSQLESDPRGAGVRGEPWTNRSQEVVAELLRNPADAFEALKENLAREGQRHPGVITREGVLYNANRRLVALRDLHNVERRWIRVAILPDDADPKELADVELRLQVQEELKAEYTLTNQLLFIEDLARTYRLSDEQIATTLRWMTRKGQPDSDKVQEYRRLLILIRELQALADPRVPLTFFDGKLEHLEALEEKYTAASREDPIGAKRFLQKWLLTALAGQSSVHRLRFVYTGDFDDYLVSRLSEQDVVRAHAMAGANAGGRATPQGVDELAPEDTDEDTGAEKAVEFSVLIKAFTSQAPEVAMPDGTTADRISIQEAVREAVVGTVNDLRQVDRAEGRLDQPVAQLREAVRHLKLAAESYAEVSGETEFEQTRRGQFNYQLRQLRKAVKRLEGVAAEKDEDRPAK
jgi:hypothetical protein